MKRNIIFLIAALALMLFAGCDKQVLGPVLDGATGFSFAAPVLNMETEPADDNILRIPVFRAAGSEDMANIKCEFYDPETKSYVAADPEGRFRLATSRVMFLDDARTGYVQVGYSSLDDFGMTEKYSFRLSIDSPITPGGYATTMVTVNRRLTFDSLGTGTFYDEFLFYETYDVEILKAREGEIYRVMHPFDEGLVAEDYVKNGWYTTPSEYIQIEVKPNGEIRFDEFANGMYFQKTYVVYGVNPPERKEHLEADCSGFSNSWLDSKTLSLYPFYYIKSYGYFDCYPMIITLP